MQYVQYIVIFIGLYLQVFFLLTFLWWGKKAKKIEGVILDQDLPTVTALVPCWNEEQTVGRTVDSLLALNYPKDKLSIILIDDGSKDRTWEIMQEYAGKYDQVTAYTKPNGGKHTALNLGIQHSTADIIGCLDADSWAHPEALREVVSRFMADASVMAVTSALTVGHPKAFLQYLQKVEFEFLIYMRQVFDGLSNSLFVASGCFSFFRKEVFATIGGYVEGHRGEDLELTMRMQKNHMKVVFADTAWSYTPGMKSFSGLIKQRTRWIYAFLGNFFDKNYRTMVFNRKYGHFGMFVLPISLVGIFFVIFFVPVSFYFILQGLVRLVIDIVATSPESIAHTLSHTSFSTIVIDNFMILSVLTLPFLVAGVMIGRHMARQKLLSIDILSFIAYPYVSCVWTVKALYKYASSQDVAWR